VVAASVEDLVRADDAVGGLIARLGSGRRAAKTSVEWSVRDVVHHLVVMNRIFAALLDGGPMPERGIDHLGTIRWSPSGSPR
jgi:uncharacterized damage-inducible protein DinB